MAQLSTDTLAYSQIISKVQKFVSDYSVLKNTSPKDYDKAYQKLLFEIHQSIGGVSAKNIFLNKGNVPSSNEFNEFIFNLTNDLNIVTNQFDTLSANYINTFNLFSNQLEAEKNSISRIRSKINVLEFYSKSSSNDITYYGDSFNDLSLVDSSKISTGYIPDISDGYATLAKQSSKNWKCAIRVVNENYNESISDEISFVKPSNGLKGNHFLFHQDGNDNPFLYEKDASILRSNESAILDGSAATYFEYEAVNVLAVNDSNYYNSRPEYEFEYFDNGKYINWAKFDTSKPLSLTIEFTNSAQSGDYINYISILPFFGYDIPGTNSLIKNVKVTSIKLFDSINNTTYELINGDPVTIGSDISSRNVDNYKNFFYNKGVFRFEEKKVNKIYITLEQAEFNDTLIKHAYWTPYEINSNQKWNNQSRFNPNGVISSSPITTSWDKSTLVPEITNPAKYKTAAADMKQIVISKNETVSTQLKYQIKLTSGQEAYYWYRRDPDLNVDLFCTKANAPYYPNQDSLLASIQRIRSENPPSACVLVDPTIDITKQLNSLKIRMQSIQISSGVATLTTLLDHNLSVGSKVYIRDRWGSIDILGTFTVSEILNSKEFKVATSYSGDLALTDISSNFGLCLKSVASPTSSNLSIESSSDPINKTSKVYLNLKRNFEYLKAKRASIGIRDISFGKETFKDSAEIVSKPFFIHGQLELLSLEVSEYIPQTESNRAGIKYYISVDGGNRWIQISPIERNFSGIPEILAFNQNLTDNSTVPQIAYYNEPEVPNPINSVILKAVIQKDRMVNSTPILYWYKLGARIV
jgi:hypothetical protein